ncbi:MAG: nucleoside hydrolase [Planctomycetes bacterium]|nr:nucleoside hydrolase [Planctomycetota bacterium]
MTAASLPTAAKPQKIILDTDIGDDIDDALALGLIIACPELDLVGVTTVYGNTVARARQARSILATAGGRFRDIPVAAGCGATMSTRPPKNGGTVAYLANTLPNQDASCLPEAQLPKLDSRHGVDFLIETIMAGNGDIVPVTIGAMTNLAMALVKEPRIAAKIPRIVAMAADFKKQFSEWNIRCDPEAAALVFSSGIPIDITTFEMGIIAKFDRSHIDRLRAGTSPLAKQLSKTVDPWCELHKDTPALFDPFAVATMIKPELAHWKQGTVEVELRGERTYGYTIFTEDAAGASQPGKHRVTWSTDRTIALEYYLERVLGKGAATAKG